MKKEVVKILAVVLLGWSGASYSKEINVDKGVSLVDKIAFYSSLIIVFPL